MAADLTAPLEVATCIACGARSRFGECGEGCDDVPLDLVEVSDLDAVEALRRPVTALHAVAEALAEASRPWTALRDDGHTALAIVVAPAPAEAEALVEAWGCPSCGRMDAPQPCLGVCVRRPVDMVGAARFREWAAEAAALRQADAALTPVAQLVAHVTHAPGTRPAPSTPCARAPAPPCRERPTRRRRPAAASSG